MDIARYRAFVAAAETGSLSRAGEQLNYSPSGVSQLINALEGELELTLLNRTRRGVMLTSAGEVLLPAVRSLLQQENRVLNLASEMNGLLIGEINIATYSSIASHWLPRMIKRFKQDYPNVKISLMEGTRREILQWLSESRADIAFLSRVSDSSYDWIPLKNDPMVALLPKDHPFAKSRVYPLSACEQEQFIMPALGKDEDVLELFDRAGVHPQIAYSTLEVYAIYSMIEYGLGMTITNELITEGFQMDFVKIPVDPPQHLELGILIPDLKAISPSAKKFIQYAKQDLQH